MSAFREGRRPTGRGLDIYKQIRKEITGRDGTDGKSLVIIYAGFLSDSRLLSPSL